MLLVRVLAAAANLPGLTDVAQEALTPLGALSIDIAAGHAASELRLAIEADGPTCFLQPGRLETDDTRARNRAHAARGYVVAGTGCGATLPVGPLCWPRWSRPRCTRRGLRACGVSDPFVHPALVILQ